VNTQRDAAEQKSVPCAATQSIGMSISTSPTSKRSPRSVRQPHTLNSRMRSDDTRLYETNTPGSGDDDDVDEEKNSAGDDDVAGRRPKAGCPEQSTLSASARNAGKRNFADISMFFWYSIIPQSLYIPEEYGRRK